MQNSKPKNRFSLLLVMSLMVLSAFLFVANKKHRKVWNVEKAQYEQKISTLQHKVDSLSGNQKVPFSQRLQNLVKQKK